VGVESVGLVWLVVVLATIAVSKAAASLNAAAILSAGDALHTGTALWSLGFGGSTALIVPVVVLAEPGRRMVTEFPTTPRAWSESFRFAETIWREDEAVNSSVSVVAVSPTRAFSAPKRRSSGAKSTEPRGSVPSWGRLRAFCHFLIAQMVFQSKWPLGVASK